MLYAGAGKSDVLYTEQMLPLYGENYIAIHDLPGVQALILEQGGQRIALVTLELVILNDRTDLLRRLSGKLELPEENIIIHTSHVLSTPHVQHWDSPKDWLCDRMHGNCPPDEAPQYMARENAIYDAYIRAAENACESAKAALRPAKVGISSIQAAVNVNRVVETKDGWWQGVNPDGPTDQTVTVITIRDVEDNPLCVLYNCNVAPGCMELSQCGDGRQISGDMAAASRRFVEQYLGEDVVAMYLTGASGDQWQALRARVDYLTPDGEQVIDDKGEQGFALMEVLGLRLGQRVIQAVRETTGYAADPVLLLDRQTVAYPGQRVIGADFSKPAKSCSYEQTEPELTGQSVLRIGDCAILCCGVEIGVDSLARLKAESPFAYTTVLEFSEQGGGYLPRATYYEMVSFQALKSRFYQGGTEHWEEDAVTLLCKAKG